MSVLIMLFAILNLYASSKAICIHRYSRTGQPHPLFSKLQKQIASYPSAIIFSLIIREYDIISPH